MIGFIRAFWNNRSGATAMEYGMICAVIGIVLLGALSRLSGVVWNVMTAVSNAIH